MQNRIVFLTALAGIACWAQPNGRRAAIIGGGDPDHGRCTVEVVVDGAASIDIQDDRAALRDTSGAPPQWRRFDCTAAIPPGAELRFRPIQGRGRQEMRESRDGTAMIRIEDPEAGSDTYVFELAWGREGGPGRVYDRGERAYDGDAYFRQREEALRGDWHARVFERVRDDLEHVQTVTFPPDRDEFRLEQTMRELSELQSSWRSGTYQPQQLDDVIRSLQRVVADNRLGTRERDILNDDLNRLRDFREHNGWR